MACRMLPEAVVVRCPPLAAYSAEKSKAIGEALRALRGREPGNVLIGVIEDAHRLREGCRALGARR